MMKRMLSMIAGLMSAMTILAFAGPVGARAPAPGARPRVSSPETSGRTPRAAIRVESASGRQVYMRNCARCHGGDANGKKGPALVGRSLNQDEIEEMVSAGQPSRMPAFGKQLSADEISAVAAYVRSLGGRS
jgi:mono/diheme cytochrome c family protein